MSLFQTFKKMQNRPVMVGIGIFALVSFSITGAVNLAFQRDPREAANETATLPSGKKATLGLAERNLAQLTYAVFYDDVLIQLAQQFQASGLFQKWIEFAGTRSILEGEAAIGRKRKNDTTEQIMLLAALGRDQGVVATQGDVERWLADAFQSAEQYRKICGALNLTAENFETALREALLVKRVVFLAQQQTPMPSGAEIEKELLERNEKFTFEAVALSAEDFKKKIDPATVSNDDLKAYLDGLNEFSKGKYREPEKYVLEGLAVLNPQDKQSDAFEALVTASAVQDQDARTYFSVARMARFQGMKKNPNYDPAASQPQTQPAELPVEFDDVKEKATREAQVARALEKVLEEVKTEMAKPGFELKTTAAKYGLTLWTSGEPKDTAGIRTLAVHGGQALVTPLVDAKEGEFLTGHQPVEGGLEVTRVVKKIASRIPEAAEIRDKALPDYLDSRAWEMVRDEARDLAAAAKAATGDDRLAKAAKEKGLEVKAFTPMTKLFAREPQFQALDMKAPERFLAQQNFGGRGVRDRADLFELKAGDVAGPSTDEANKVAYVVRCAARAVPKLEELGPSDYIGARDEIVNKLRAKMAHESLSTEALMKALKVEMPAIAKNEDAEKDGDPAR